MKTLGWCLALIGALIWGAMALTNPYLFMALLAWLGILLFTLGPLCAAWGSWRLRLSRPQAARAAMQALAISAIAWTALWIAGEESHGFFYRFAGLAHSGAFFTSVSAAAAIASAFLVGPAIAGWARTATLAAAVTCFATGMGWELAGKDAFARYTAAQWEETIAQRATECLSRWLPRTVPQSPLPPDWRETDHRVFEHFALWSALGASRSIAVDQQCDLMTARIGCETPCPASDPLASDPQATAALVRQQLLALAALVHDPTMLRAAADAIKEPLPPADSWLTFAPRVGDNLTLKWRWRGAQTDEEGLSLQVQIGVRGEWE